MYSTSRLPFALIFGDVMKETLLRKRINEELDKRTVPETALVLPHGYNPLEKIRGGMFHYVAVPFNGVKVWCELRTLNSTQIRACGDFSSIVREGKTEFSIDEMIVFRNYQEKLIAASLNKPTFDDIARLVGDNDFVIKEKRAELDALKAVDLTPLPVTRRVELQERMTELNLFIGFILPEDTFAFLVSWAHGNDVSDIRAISDEQFLEAAILAENGHDNPTDHIDGIFTDHNKVDMDRYAWSVYANYLKEKHIENKTKRKGIVIGGPKQGA
jgi:hypothetical protein